MSSAAQPKPPGRIRRGWELAKASWSVLRTHRSLMAFPILGSICGFAAAIVLFAPGAAIALADSKANWAMIPFGVLALYAATFFAIFFSVALAACTAEAISGGTPTVGSGIRAARGKLGVIAGWAAVQLTVGLIINAIQGALRNEGGGAAIAGAVIGSLAGLAWAVATFFVIPVIALEGLGPKAAIKRSAHVVKERWGEGAVGSSAIGLVALPLILLAIVCIVGAAAIAKTAVAGAVALGVLAAIFFFLTVLLTSSLQAVFRVVLFRYAQDGTVPAGWSSAALEGAFQQRRTPFGRRA